MDKNEIEKYIDKLKSFEKQLLGEDSENLLMLNELDTLLCSLGEKVQKEMIIDTNKLKIKIKKTHPNAVIPTYSKNGDAGMDLVATEIISESPKQITYGTGLAIEIPEGYVGLVFPRSSIRNKNLLLKNSTGIIDSGYRGQIICSFEKTIESMYMPLIYTSGDKIAQLIIMPYPQILFTEVNELSETERGDGGFGSTGA